MVPWRSSIRPIEPGDDRTFDLARCGSCGSAATLGTPPDATAYEKGQYAPLDRRAARRLAPVQRAVSGHPARLLARAGVPVRARVLDVGAGTGLLVDALLRAGFRASGVEPSMASSAAARANGLPVRTAALEAAEERDLDAVTMWQVLEHLDEPLDALLQVRSMLRPGGMLLLGVPNIQSLQARIAGDEWFHLDVPRHRTHFSPAGVDALLQRAGYRTLATHHVVWKHNPDGMWFALLSRFGVRPGAPYFALRGVTALSRREMAITVAAVPGLPIAVALELAAAAGRRGGTFVTVAQAAGVDRLDQPRRDSEHGRSPIRQAGEPAGADGSPRAW